MSVVTDDELKGLFEAMRQETAAMRGETASRFDAMREETALRFDEVREENAAAHAETRSHVDASVERLERKVDAAVDRLENKFDVTREHLESRFELLAETVQLVNENQRANVLALDQKIDQKIAETQGLIKFLYDDVNRRVLVLEGNTGKKK
jgi:2',3'-cyclic-nucleotide 2'-phosphodiesterase (5'-nucleotidase family)